MSRPAPLPPSPASSQLREARYSSHRLLRERPDTYPSMPSPPPPKPPDPSRFAFHDYSPAEKSERQADREPLVSRRPTLIHRGASRGRQAQEPPIDRDPPHSRLEKPQHPPPTPLYRESACSARSSRQPG